MSFESGSISFRLFLFNQQDPAALLEALARRSAPPLEQLGQDPVSGWATGRCLLDRDLTEEKCLFGSYLYVMLMKAERKAPASLLRAQLQMEEEIERRARGVDFLPRAACAEIRKRVVEALLPTMPPTLTGIPAIVDFRNGLLIASALADKQIDALCAALRDASGESPLLLTPETVALRRLQINVKDLSPVNFSPDPSVEPPAEPTLGMDFLTWIWFLWESKGGICHLPDGREFGVMIEGPLTFFHEGAGAHEAILRKGAPANSREAAAALKCGKKLRRAKVTIGLREAVYSANVDADFAFRSINLPKAEQLDAYGRFLERMLRLETFWNAWMALFDHFLALRADAQKWPETLAAMRQWIERIGEPAS